MMLQAFFARLKQLDWVLFALSFVLVSFGLAALYSVSVQAEGGDPSRLVRQVEFSAIGLVVLFLSSFIDYRLLRSWKNTLYVAAVLLLGGVLLFGTVIRETQRWYAVFGVTIQPSEIAKIILIVFLAATFSTQAPPRGWRTVLTTGVSTLFLMVLLFFQPDAGTALFFFAIWAVMLLIARVERRVLLLLIVSLLVLAVLAWTFVLQDYQQQRIRTFFDPTHDPLGVGYNVTQSIIAVGSGQFFGRGLGLGPQSQLNFLPEQETDFIFAVIAEELGFVGVLLVLAVFALLLARMLMIARRARDYFSFYVVMGIVSAFTVQIVVNVGMNVGLLPITGIPLPFVSAGGSSLVANLFMIGILQNISLQQRKTYYRSP